MTADALFRLCNSLALAGWLLLVVTGWSPRASRIISSLITGLLVPALLCGLYLMLILTHWGGHKGGFSSLSGARACRMGPLPGLRPLHWQLAGTRRKAQPCAVSGGAPVPGLDFPLWPHRPAALSISGRPHLSRKSLAWSSRRRYLTSRDLEPDGCPTFAPAYVRRERWAKPNHGFNTVDQQKHSKHITSLPRSKLTTERGCPTSRSFFARCGIPLLLIEVPAWGTKGHRVNHPP
jgi:hypothetical protein